MATREVLLDWQHRATIWRSLIEDNDGLDEYILEYEIQSRLDNAYS